MKIIGKNNEKIKKNKKKDKYPLKKEMEKNQ